MGRWQKGESKAFNPQDQEGNNWLGNTSFMVKVSKECIYKQTFVLKLYSQTFRLLINKAKFVVFLLGGKQLDGLNWT